MLYQHECFSNTTQSSADMDKITSYSTHQHLSFQRQMVQNLRARSKANEERLRNEIAFVDLSFNIVDSFH